jgi:MFS family permease
MVALPGVVLYPVGPLLLLDQRLRNYNTSKPIETFHVEGFLQILTGLMGTALLLALAAALIVTFYPRAVEELRRGNRRMMGMDAAFAVMAAAGIALIFRHLGAALTSMFHAQALLDVGAPAIIVSTAPAVAAVTDAVSEVITRGAALGLVAMMVYQTKRLWLLLLGVLIGLGALVSTDARTLSEFSLEYGMAVSVAAAVVVFCWFFGRRNYLAYALILWLAALQGPLSDLMGTGNPSLQAQAWAIVVVMVLSVLWAVGPAVWKADARPSGSAALS